MGSVLVINCGSSSAKLALYPSAQASSPSLTALAERLVVEANSSINIKGALNAEQSLGDNATHKQAIEAFLALAKDHLGNLQGIGHRVVHGGEYFKTSTLMDAENIQRLRPLNDMAPLHNPANLQGIELGAELFGNVPQVAVFDTSFHQSIPATRYLYGTPYSWYEDYGVRHYGFHGISYDYVTGAAAQRLGKPRSEVNLVIAHLGNGCSATAVYQGQSADCSMGLTPLEGLIMGTRCGDIDPGLIEHMLRSSSLSFAEIMNDLNRNSGLKGLSGLGNDMRSLLEAKAQGHEGAARAIDVFSFRVARHFSALATTLPNIDAVVFTGGIGEKAAPVRAQILTHWANQQFQLDDALNAANGDEQGRITALGSPLALVIPTNEELLIAQDTFRLTSSL